MKALASRQQRLMRENYKRFISNKDIEQSEEGHAYGKAEMGIILLVGLIIFTVIINAI